MNWRWLIEPPYWPYFLGVGLGIVGIVFLSSCAGSPRITINKNTYVIDSDGAETKYTTESSTTSVAEIVQDLKDLLKVTPK